MAVDQVKSSGSRLSTARVLASNLGGWLSAIHSPLIRAARHVFRSRDFAPDLSPAEPVARQDTVIADASPNVTAAAEPAVSVQSGSRAKPNLVTPIASDQEEIERRRNLVRTLFNYYWIGVQEKPAAFSERLDQAEDYLNERLAAEGEVWRLDAHTRVMLGLPPRSR